MTDGGTILILAGLLAMLVTPAELHFARRRDDQPADRNN